MSEIYKIKDFSFIYPFQKKGIKINGEFVIKEKETILLTGNSGSGKTTLLYALKGLIPKTIFGKFDGEIYFKQKNILHLTDYEKLKIGLVFQNPSTQMINRRVKDELAFGLENLKMSVDKMENKILQASMDFEITHLLHRDLKSLSGGEKQKIALISIMLTNPDVLLLDEPTAFLDPDSAEKFINIFKKFALNKTAILVEHNLHYLKKLVTKVIEIKNGIVYERNFNFESQFIKIPTTKTDKIILEIKNLTFEYEKNNPIIYKLNLNLFEKEVIGIMGNNGIGKSTLLKLIAKLIKPKSGEILVFGKKNYSRKEYYKKIGLLLQNPENHFLFSKVYKETGQQNLKLFNLEHLASQNPFTLSEGEKRRLSLAIVLNNKPDIILMDEPTFGQDIKNKQILIDLIFQLKEKKHSFIIVSHDVHFLNAVCDRILILKDRKLYETK